jgi:hypothetical protein
MARVGAYRRSDPVVASFSGYALPCVTARSRPSSGRLTGPAGRRGSLDPSTHDATPRHEVGRGFDVRRLRVRAARMIVVLRRGHCGDRLRVGQQHGSDGDRDGRLPHRLKSVGVGAVARRRITLRRDERRVIKEIHARGASTREIAEAVESRTPRSRSGSTRRTASPRA